jgi:AraC-like DNA-binding protein
VKRPNAAWRGHLEDYYWLHDILRVSVGVPAWALEIDAKGGQQWRDLSLVLPPLAPYHFEIAFGREGERDRYYRRLMKQVMEQGRPVEGQLHGAMDLMVPLGRSRGRSTALYLGQYLGAPPSYDGLAAAWTGLSRRPAAPGDGDFIAFLSATLRLPILPPPAREGLRDFGLLYAAHLRGERARGGLERTLEALRQRAFRPWLPHPVWAYQAIGFDKQRQTPWWPAQELAPWMREELGLRRPPTTVLALLPLGLEPGRARVAARALLFDAWAWCRRRGGITVAPLFEDGVVFLAETPEGKGSAAVRAGLGDLAEELRALARRREALDCAVGIGEPVPRGQRLWASYQQALLSLQLALQQGRRVLFHSQAGRQREAFSYARLAAASRALAGVFERGSLDALRPAADEHVRRVLEYAAGRLELARGQCLASLFACVEALGRRAAPDDEALQALARSAAHPLEQAPSLSALLNAYHEALAGLAELAGAGGGRLGVQGLIRWLEEHYQRPLPLAAAAKQAGLSVPVFTRAFRQATGRSFADWLRQRRCDAAEELLRHSRLGVAEIARDCGFSAVHAFLRAFKARHRMTPGAWRQKRAPRALSVRPERK